MKKAIKINVESRSVEYIELEDSCTGIYEAIGNRCGTFCIPYTFENNDCIYADDEALLKSDQIKGGFFFEEWNRPIVGNGLVVATGSEGEMIDCRTTIEDIKKQIVFISEYTSKQWANEWMRDAESMPTKIITNNP